MIKIIGATLFVLLITGVALTHRPEIVTSGGQNAGIGLIVIILLLLNYAA
jgi:hypothetical protein